MSALSPRQREVLDLLVAGHSNREAAELLGLSVKTIETHRARLYSALDVNTRAGLVAASKRLGA